MVNDTSPSWRWTEEHEIRYPVRTLASRKFKGKFSEQNKKLKVQAMEGRRDVMELHTAI